MNRAGRNLFMGLVLLILLAPLFVVAGVSLNEKKELIFPPHGFSLGWYGELLSQADWLNAIRHSLIIAVLSALLAVSVAFPLAYFLWRHKVWYAQILFTLGVKRMKEESDPVWVVLALTDHGVSGPSQDDAPLKGLGFYPGASVTEREVRSPSGSPARCGVRRVR